MPGHRKVEQGARKRRGASYHLDSTRSRASVGANGGDHRE